MENLQFKGTSIKLINAWITWLLLAINHKNLYSESAQRGLFVIGKKDIAFLNALDEIYSFRLFNFWNYSEDLPIKKYFCFKQTEITEGSKKIEAYLLEFQNLISTEEINSNA